MNILILGCSFGVPNYFGLPGSAPNAHTEFLLKDLGYNVFNCASNSGSNLYSLHRAEQLMTGEKIHHPAYKRYYMSIEPPSHIDWIIWFHTELIRDLEKLDCISKNFTIDTEALANLTYTKYQEFQQRQNAKLAVIGGAGDLHASFFKYFSPEFVIPSWRSEILGIKTTESQTLWRQNYFEQNKDSIQKKLELVENDLLLRELMCNSADFPDNCHPGAKPHKDLVDRLHWIFQK